MKDNLQIIQLFVAVASVLVNAFNDAITKLLRIPPTQLSIHNRFDIRCGTSGGLASEKFPKVEHHCAPSATTCAVTAL